jgi:hypothetical protein
MGVLALYSLHVDARFSGVLRLTAGKRPPLALQHGPYRVNVSLTLRYPTQFSRESSWLGNADRGKEEALTRNATVTIYVGGNNTWSGQTSVDFGTSRVVNVKRGTAGGVEILRLAGAPTVSIAVNSIEPI